MEENTEQRVDLTLFSEKIQALKDRIATVIVGQEQIVDLVLTAVLANGHVLLEGVPGVAKTLLARLVARLIKADFSRIQFTPDLMPSDVLGTTVFNMKTNDFDFHQGPVFADLVLVDEINRAPAKTQAALFEVMEERQVSIDGTTHQMGELYTILATQNPVGSFGTQRLPEAQMDRFMMQLTIGYPDREQEIRMASQFLRGETTERVQAVCCAEDLQELQREAAGITVKESVLGYMEDIVCLTRQEKRFVIGASPRAMLAMVRASQARAFFRERDYVKPDDVKAVAMQVLGHRIALSAEARIRKEDKDKILKSLIVQAKIPV